MKYRFFNKLNIIIFIFMFAIIVISFFSYMYPRYSKENELLYESIEKNCKKEYKKEICKEYGISNSESYENFMQYDPRVRKGELDLITLSQEVIKNELFSLIDIIIPLIIIENQLGLNCVFIKQFQLQKKMENFNMNGINGTILMEPKLIIEIFGIK